MMRDLPTILAFLALSYWIMWRGPWIGASKAVDMRRRRNMTGWHSLGFGVIVLAASVLWSASLHEQDLHAMLLRLWEWIYTYPLPGIGSLSALLAAHPQFDDAIKQLLQAFDQLRGVDRHWIPLLLLIVYWLLRMTIGRPLVRLASSWFWKLALRERNPVPTGTMEADKPAPLTREDCIEQINLGLSRSAGTQSLYVLSFIACLVLGLSYVTEHGRAIESWAAWRRPPFDWNPLTVHGQVLWLGIYIFALELLGQSNLLIGLKKEEAEQAAAAPAAGQPAARGSLDRLFARALGEIGPRHILYAEAGRRPPPAAAATQEETDAAPKSFAIGKIARYLRDQPGLAAEHRIEIVRVLEDFVGKSSRPDLIINEPLHPAHLRMLFTLCEHVQSRGRTSLIVCPASMVDFVKTRMDELSSETLASRVQRSAMLAETAATHERLKANYSYSFVIVSDVDFESQFLDRIGTAVEIGSVLDHLGLVVTLETQALQLSFLRLQLTRLWLELPRREVQTVMQLTYCHNAGQLHEALFPRADRQPPLTLRLDLEPWRHVLVWRNARETANALHLAAVEGVKPEDVATADGSPKYTTTTPLNLRAYALTAGEQLRLAIQEPTPNLDELRRASTQFRTSRAQKSGAGLVSAFPVRQEEEQGTADGTEGNGTREPTSARDNTVRVFVSEAAHGILGAIASFPEAHGEETLLNIVSRDYPLRDYEIGRLLAEKSRRDLVGTWVEIAPDIRYCGGKRELLATLYAALRRGLYRKQIMDEFVSKLPDGLSRQTRFIASARGIQELLDTELNTRVHLVSKVEGGDTRYSIDAGMEASASAQDAGHVRRQFRLPLYAENRDVREELPRGDYGLSYFVNQQFVVRGVEHRIEAIDVDGQARVRIRRNERQPGKAETTDLPVIEYELRPRLDEQLPAPEGWIVDGDPLSFNGGNAALYYGTFVRRTYGRLVWEADRAPLEAGADLIFEKLPEDRIVQDRIDHPVCRLQFDPPPGGFGSDIGKLAYTLAIVLQDVMRAHFPRWAHRLAAISPQASALLSPHLRVRRRAPINLQGVGQPSVRVTEVLIRAYPWLNVAAPPSPAAGAGTGRPTQGNTGAAAGSEPLDIYLIEDSDFDLGAVRALKSDPSLLIDEAFSYLKWLTEQEIGISRYHRFGGAEDSDLLVWKRALDVLRPDPRASNLKHAVALSGGPLKIEPLKIEPLPVAAE